MPSTQPANAAEVQHTLQSKTTADADNLLTPLMVMVPAPSVSKPTPTPSMEASIRNVKGLLGSCFVRHEKQHKMNANHCKM